MHASLNYCYFLLSSILLSSINIVTPSPPPMNYIYVLFLNYDFFLILFVLMCLSFKFFKKVCFYLDLDLDIGSFDSRLNYSYLFFYLGNYGENTVDCFGLPKISTFYLHNLIGLYMNAQPYIFYWVLFSLLFLI